MIIENGSITIKIKEGGGIGGDGNPIAPTYRWGDPIPCQIRANVRNNLGKSNGNAFIIAAYEVLVEGAYFEPEQVKLQNADGQEIGEFSVIHAEALREVGLVKILV